MVKNPPAMQMWVWSLGREDLLEKGMASHSSRVRVLLENLPGEFHGQRSLVGVAKSWTWFDQHFHSNFFCSGFHPWHHMIWSHQDSLIFHVLDSFLDFSFLSDLDRRKSLGGAHTSGEGLWLHPLDGWLNVPISYLKFSCIRDFYLFIYFRNRLNKNILLKRKVYRSFQIGHTKWSQAFSWRENSTLDSRVPVLLVRAVMFTAPILVQTIKLVHLQHPNEARERILKNWLAAFNKWN